MFIPRADCVPSLFNGQSPRVVPSLQLDKPSGFSLDMSGLASLMGGDDAVLAMTAVHIYQNRRLVGWYNNPGAFQIVKRLRLFAKSAILSRNSNTVHMDPMTLLDLDGSKGFKFRAAHSGTVIEKTGHLATLPVKECATWNSEGKVVQGRTTQPVWITIVVFEKVLDCPTLSKYTLSTRTTAVVFTLLVLQLQDPSHLLNELLPNDTKVWRQWKATILEQPRHPGSPAFVAERRFGDLDGFTQQEQELLELLYDDAQAAYNGYKTVSEQILRYSCQQL